MLAQCGFVQRSNHDFFVHGICHPTPVGDFSLDNALGFGDLIPVQDFWFQNACKICDLTPVGSFSSKRMIGDADS